MIDARGKLLGAVIGQPSIAGHRAAGACNCAASTVTLGESQTNPGMKAPTNPGAVGLVVGIAPEVSLFGQRPQHVDPAPGRRAQDREDQAPRISARELQEQRSRADPPREVLGHVGRVAHNQR